MVLLVVDVVVHIIYIVTVVVIYGRCEDCVVYIILTV